MTQEHTPTPWEATFFTKPDGSPIETVADVILTTTYSASRGTLAELHGVTFGEADDEGRRIVICYTGNGPTSARNAAFIARCVNSHEALVKALERLTPLARDLYAGLRVRGLPDEILKAEAALKLARGES